MKSTAQSSVIPSDAFDRLSSNDTAETATDLGKLASAYTAESSIHSEVDKDYFTFEVAYDGEAVIDLNFTHDLGDIDTILRDGAGVTVASGESGDDNEQISFKPLPERHTASKLLDIVVRLLEIMIWSLHQTTECSAR